MDTNTDGSRNDTWKVGATRFSSNKRPRNLIKVISISSFLFLIAPINNSCADVPFELITQEEAERPKAFIDERSPLPGPQIEVLSGPTQEEPHRSPFNFTLRFSPYGGATIDWKTLQVSYMTMKRVSVTDRIKRFVKEATREIEVVGAIAPPGKHQLVFSVKDSNGMTQSFKYNFLISN